jgi:hypothetical protein
LNTIVTYAPDANPMTPGILVEASGVYPSETGGVRAIPSAAPFSDALPGKCKGAFAFQDLSSSFRTVAGTGAGLFELSSTSWLDVSQSGGYTADRWRFAVWGNYILATNNSDAVQVQTGTGVDFADLDGSPPIAKYITSAQNFVILANIPSYENRVYWSAQGDHTDWTPAISTQCGYVDLSDSPGNITGLAKIGDDIVVFKERTLYHGIYVGPPYVWAFRRIPAFCGTPSQDSVIELENGVYYTGEDDFYLYDGNLPKRVGQGVRFWFLSNLDRHYQARVTGVYDGVRRLIFWYYPTNADSSGELVEALIFDYQTGRWGRTVQSIEAGLVHWSGNITYDTIANFFSQYNDIDIYYDSPWWSANYFGLAILNTDHRLARLNGAPGNASITTGDLGTLQSRSRIFKAYPYFSVSPTTCMITPQYKTKLGDTATAGTGNALKADGSADQNLIGKFINLKMNMTGDFDIGSFDADIRPVSIL